MKWPKGLSSGAGHSGIKHRSADLGVLVTDEPAVWAGVFTTNAAAAAPVEWSRQRLGAQVRALVVNSGNANACTGDPGRAAVAATASGAASVLGCSPEEILIASTGPIGIHLPVDRIVTALPGVIEGADGELEPFATSIMTTDSRIKTSSVVAGEAQITGVAKGAAMIAPNMATMLAFIGTDASFPNRTLQEMLSRCVDGSFNRISIDACESTNDSVFLISTGKVAMDKDAFEAGLRSVCSDLAEQIVRDAEGGTKLMRINVRGAATDEQCLELARSIASSDLWRAAVAGADPNWGRVLAAMGGVDRGLDLDSVEVAIGPEVVFSRGQVMGSLDVAAKVMAEDEFTLSCTVGSGSGSVELLSADLTKEYVALNSEVTT